MYTETLNKQDIQIKLLTQTNNDNLNQINNQLAENTLNEIINQNLLKELHKNDLLKDR